MKSSAFSGGVHPQDFKQFTASLAVESCPLPEELVLPLVMHIGAPATPCVEVGSRVKKGQLIAAPKGFVSAGVHASTSGEIRAIEPRMHVNGSRMQAMVLVPDGEDAWADGLEGAGPNELTGDDIRDRIRAAGIVGLGGAAFPTAVKLSPPEAKRINTLIINGVECEPFLTADHRLMLEEGERVLDGIEILRCLLGVDRAILGIEDNKPDAIAHMDKLCRKSVVEVKALPVRYPQGAEKQLIFAACGRTVPSGGLPMDVGVVVQNVGTAAAVSDAIRKGRPLVERICTVSGPGLVRPANLRIPIGAPLSHLVKVCGGLRGRTTKILAGGPMMGMAQAGLEASATKGTSGLLIFDETAAQLRPEGPCIRCGRCVSACPMRISPTTIAAYSRLDMIDAAEQNNAMDCIECGCCSYICPAGLPLVQSLRYARGAIAARRRRV